MTAIAARPALPGRRRWLAPLIAASLAILVVGTVSAVLGLTPFGPVGRGIGDYGPQYLPFHLYLHDVLHGRAYGDLHFTWSASAGTGFLPDYATYLGGPFTPLVALFDRTQMDTAILVISLLRIGLAAALMVVLLRTLRPSAPALPAIVLAVGYASGSWVFEQGLMTPQWLDGLWAFPALCLAALATVRRRALLGPVVVVAVVWWSNYYSGLMASLGAGLFLTAWLVATGRPLLVNLSRFALRGALGVAAMGWLLWPTLRAVRAASQAPNVPSLVDSPDALLGWFGFVDGIARRPALFVGSLALVLVGAVVMAKHLELRARLTWFGLALLGLVLVRLSPAVWLFNGADVPNGNAYRWSFVVAGLVLIAGWHAIAPRLPGRGARGWLTGAQVAAGAALLALVAAVAATSNVATHGPSQHAWLFVPTLVVALLALGSTLGARRRGHLLVQVVVGGLVVLELVWSAVAIIPPGRRDYGVSEPYSATGALELERAAAVRAAVTWPQHRAAATVSEQPTWNAYNLGQRSGLPAVGGYSSTMPAVVETTLGQLGLVAVGRHVREDTGRLPRTVLAMQAGWSLQQEQVVTWPTLPMMRTVQPSASERGGLASLFNRPVAHPVTTSVRWQDGTPAQTDARGVVSRPDQLLVQTATCNSGGTLVYRTPNLLGKAVWMRWAGQEQIVAAAGQFVEDLPGGTEVSFHYFSTNGPTTELGQPFCLDLPELDLEVAETISPVITVRGGRISGTFPGPQTGTVVIATVGQSGWSCSADGRRVERSSAHGLLAVPVDGATTVECSFRQPGLRLGLALSALALLVIAGLAGWTHRHRLAGLARTPIAGQVVRFGIVGVANTLVYYLLYRLLLATTLPYVAAHLMAWAVSVVFSYFANCWFTYRVRPSWRSFIAFPATTLVNVAFTTLGSVLLVSQLGADTRYVTLVMGILAIPVTFLITRLVLVGRRPSRATPPPTA